MPLTFDQYKALRMKGLTDDQIREAQSTGRIDKVLQPQSDAGGFIQNTISNIPSSAGDFVSSIGQAVLHPIKTVQALGQTALGGVEKLLPGQQEGEVQFDAVVSFFKDRYGSFDGLKNTIETDPIGFLADAATVLTAGGALVTKIGTAGKLAEFAGIASRAERIAAIQKAAQAGELGEIARAGNILTKAGEFTDPISLLTKSIGKAAEVATAGKTVAPFAKSFEADTAKAFADAGIDAPTSAVTRSNVIQGLEALVSKGVFGSKVVKFVEDAANKLDDLANNIITQTGKTPSMQAAGEVIVKGFNDLREVFYDRKGKLYSAAKIDMIPIKASQLEETINVLKEIVQTKKGAAKLVGSAEGLPLFKTLLKNIKNKKVKANEVEQAIRELSKRANNFADPVAVGNQAVIKRIIAVMDKELTVAIKQARPKAAKVIEAADEFYKLNIRKLNSTWGKRIKSLADKGQPDRILNEVLLSKITSVDQVKQVLKLVGEDGVKQIQSTLAEQIFKKSRLANSSFSAVKLKQAINSIGEGKVQAILGKDKFTALKNIEKMAGGLQRGLKVAEGSQTAFLGRLLTEGGLLFTNPLAGLQLIVGDYVFSKIVASKAFRQLVTEGFDMTGETGRKIQEVAPKIGKKTRQLFQAGRVEEITN